MKDKIFRAFDSVYLKEHEHVKIIDDVVNGSVKGKMTDKSFWEGRLGGVVVVAMAALIFAVVNIVMLGGAGNGGQGKTPLNSGEVPLISNETTANDVTGETTTVTEVMNDTKIIIDPTTVVGGELEDIVIMAPLDNYTIIIGYGARWGELHEGVDMVADDLNVYAAASGTVIWAEYDKERGNLIKIDHGNDIISEYGSLEAMNVNVGDVVSQGSVIGKMGNTGMSTGVHLCWRVSVNGKYVDPMTMLE